MSAVDRLDQIEARALTYNEIGFPHEGDCSGSLCPVCGHCLHSIAVCDHDCDGQGNGCRDAVDDETVLLKRDTVALVTALRAVLDVLDGPTGTGNEPGRGEEDGNWFRGNRHMRVAVRRAFESAIGGAE